MPAAVRVGATEHVICGGDLQADPRRQHVLSDLRNSRAGSNGMDDARGDIDLESLVDIVVRCPDYAIEVRSVDKLRVDKQEVVDAQVCELLGDDRTRPT